MIAYLYKTLTSFRLEVGDAVHDDMVKEQGFVVDLDVSREQAAEVLHIPERGGDKEDMNRPPSVKLYHGSSYFTSKG